MSVSKKTPDPDKVKWLEEQARKINESHGQCLASFRIGVQHARRTGKLLNEAKKKVAHKNWEDWVKANCKFEVRMAQNYMRIAKHYKNVEEKEGPVDQLTMTQLLDRIKKALDEEENEQAGARPSKQQGDADQTDKAGSKPTGAASVRNDPDAPFRLSEDGYKLKRQELDARRAEGSLNVEDDVKLAGFLDQSAQDVYTAIRSKVSRELAQMASDNKLDLAHLAIVVIDKLKKLLRAEKVFLPPVEQKPAEPKPVEEKGKTEQETEQGPVHRLTEHLNGHAEKASVVG